MNSNTDVVTLRQVVRLLVKHISEDKENTLHWADVIGEDSILPVAKLPWTYNDDLLQISVAQGFSEGCLIYVHAQKSCYKPDEIKALFRIKVLCNAKRAFAEAANVWIFFQSRNFRDLVGQS